MFSVFKKHNLKLICLIFFRWLPLNPEQVAQLCNHSWRRLPTRCQFHQHFTQKFFVQKCFMQFFELQFGFVIFWQKNIRAKSACKMLMKSTTGTIHIDNSYGYANGTKDFEVRIKMFICRFNLKQGSQIYSLWIHCVNIKNQFWRKC